MTCRERVLAALRHEPTDRVPRLLYGEAIAYAPAIAALLEARCAPLTPRQYFDMDITGAALAPTRLDAARFAPWLGARAGQALASGAVDEWGVWWRRGSFHHFAHIESPLRQVESLSQLEEYPWPDVDAPYRCAGLAEQVAALHDQGLAVAAFAGSVFEQSWYLRGMDELMMDMLAEPERAHWILERTAHYQKVAAVAFARAGVDILITGDDVAMQEGLMMDRATWRAFLQPRLAATVAAARTVRPDLHVFYHSDGNVEPLIPDLIEVGIDILNPVQPECMDPAAIKAKYGDRLSFWGTVSVQHTMPQGTPDQVRAEVRQRIRTAGRGGGLILAPAHVLTPEVPWENIAAFFAAAGTEPVPS
ncbi:MAG: uroporphyrinogen decarboxylase family protein [Gemmatimonadota bacterium]